MTQFWNTKDPAPTDADFIYIGTPDRIGCRIVSRGRWRDANEEHDEGYWDNDIGAEADIAGWLPMPELRSDPE